MSVARPAEAAIRLWIHLIGPMQAVDGTGTSLLPRSRKARAVLAILALSAPRPVSRVRITALLWSQREREQARGSLRQCVHEIQGLFQALGPGVIEADREQLRLVDDSFWLDVRDANSETPGVLLEDLIGLDPAFDEWVRDGQSRNAPRPASAHEERGARIGVRQLRTLGGHDETVLAEGLAEEIAAALSRFRWMPCLTLGGATQGAGEADVEYVLGGAVRRIGDQIRVTLRLQDMRAAAEVIWARNFDGTPAELLSFLDRIVEQTAAQVDPELMLREGARAAEQVARDGIAPASVLVLGSIPAIYRLDREGFEAAGHMLEEAVRLAPENAMAHAWFAHWQVMAVGQGWEPDPTTAIARAGALAERAIMLDPSDGRALTIAGHVRGFLGKQAEEALLLHDRALALNPALAWAWMMSGLAHCYRGDHREAIRRIETARRLSPFDPQAFFFDMSLTMPHLMLGNFERAVELGRLSVQLKPSFSAGWKALLVGLGYLGRLAEANDALARLQALEPGFSVSEAVRRSPLRRPEDLQRFAEGLRLGGLDA